MLSQMWSNNEQGGRRMREIAFIVKKDSKMYESYMIEKTEKQRFHNFAYDFFEKRDFGKGDKYILSERLSLELDSEHIEKYKNQLIADRDDGFSRFKLNSKIQKEWESEVVSKCDMNKLRHNSIWYYDFIYSGSSAMWDYQGQVYGYLSSKHEDIKTCDDMKIIKLSEYYKIIEEIENKAD